ncbi:MAG: hypothetical protein ACLQDY_13080 [Streptosporangiaceae bacterium]
MAIIIADALAVYSGNDQAQALLMLSMLTGVVMLAADFLRLGSMPRFVSHWQSVAVGLVTIALRTATAAAWAGFPARVLCLGSDPHPQAS